MDKCWSPFGSRNWNLDKPGAGTYHDWSEIAHRWAWTPPCLPVHTHTHTHTHTNMKIFSENLFLKNSQSGSTSSQWFLAKSPWPRDRVHVTRAVLDGNWRNIKNKQQLRVEFGFWTTSRREFHVVGQARWLVVFRSSIPFHSTGRSTQKNSPSLPPAAAPLYPTLGAWTSTHIGTMVKICKIHVNY
jgi:hypothetical protein